MKEDRGKHGEQGFMIEPLLLLVAVAVFLAFFLPAFRDAQRHDHSILASVGFGLLPAVAGLAFLSGGLWAFVKVAMWSDARKKRRELERERRG